VSVSDQGRVVVARKRTMIQTFRTVAWSFFGVRKAEDHESDVSELNPVHVVVGGVIGALVLVLLLSGLVNWVLSSGVAA